jgi:hypothetical protein
MFFFTDGDENLFQIGAPDHVVSYSELSQVKVDLFKKLLEVDAKVFWQCVYSFT